MNFNVLEGRIKEEINDFSSRTAVRITRWINRCHRFICLHKRWSFLVVRRSDELELDNDDMPLDIETDIEAGGVVAPAQNVIQVYDITDGTWQEVKKSYHRAVRDRFKNEYGQAGAPLFWYYIDPKKVEFFPILDEKRKFVFSIQKKVPEYTTGSTAPLLIPDEYIDVLTDYVLYRAFSYKTDDRAAIARQDYFEGLSAMIDAEAIKTGISYDDRPAGASRFPMVIDVDGGEW